MKKIIILMSILLVVCLALCSCSISFSTTPNASETSTTEQVTEQVTQQNASESLGAPEHEINLEGLKKIEAADTFKVKIKSQELIRDAFSGISIGGHDAYSLKIENKSGGTIEDVTVYVVGYKSNNDLYKMTSGNVSIGSNSYATAFVSEEGAKYDNNTTFEFNVKCDMSEFSSCRAIVAGYTDASGKEVTNPSAEEWAKNVEKGQVTKIN